MDIKRTQVFSVQLASRLKVTAYAKADAKPYSVELKFQFGSPTELIATDLRELVRFAREVGIDVDPHPIQPHVCNARQIVEREHLRYIQGCIWQPDHVGPHRWADLDIIHVLRPDIRG